MSAPEQARTTRLDAIDALRGLVITWMVLDHTRDFLSAAEFSPTDLARTTPVFFFTRWITHYCAPTFVFLAGVSARLMAGRLAPSALRRFLFTRGLWLIVLEFTLVNFVWNFNLGYRMGLILQVIWAIGAAMTVLAALSVLPEWAIAGVSLLLISGHNTLDGIAPTRFGAWAPLWNVLHVEGEVPFGHVIYPLIPWIGTIALGFVAGRLYTLPSAQRKRWLYGAGFAACAAFVVVRALNGYGDPEPWRVQDDPLFTVLSFLNVSKYPPSLDYLLMTLGPAALALAALEGRDNAATRALCVVGRVPLFAYWVHLALVHLLAGALGFATGHGAAMLTEIFVYYPRPSGFSLAFVYLAWLAVLGALFPLCRWFGMVKARRAHWWLAYL